MPSTYRMTTNGAAVDAARRRMEDLGDWDGCSDEPVEIELLAAESAVVLVNPQTSGSAAGSNRSGVFEFRSPPASGSAAIQGDRETPREPSWCAVGRIHVVSLQVEMLGADARTVR